MSDEVTVVEEDEQVDVVDQLVPRNDAKEWTLELDGDVRTYVQDSLTFFGKLEFISIVGEAIDELLAQENVSVAGIIDDSLSGIGSDSFASVDSFLGTVARVSRYVPGFLKDVYCVALNIPKDQREWARDAFDNLSDDDALEIIERFIDQNAEVLVDFFTEKVRKLVERVRKQIPGNAAASASSKPSKPTRRRTPKK